LSVTFEQFDLLPEIQYGIQDLGYKSCTPIQEQAIPVILQGKDLIGCAQTGTGKTAAFVIPMLQFIQNHPGKDIKALVIVPTRELAKQIDELIDGLAYHSPVRSVAVYGGGKSDDWSVQQNAIKKGADILIATPGRLIAHIQLGYVDLSHLKFLVLDEADKMLDMGFYEDIMGIIAKTPVERQTLMFSATMPPNIRKMAKVILKDPEEISIRVSLPAEKIRQYAYLAHDNQKTALLEVIFSHKTVGMMILFTSRKRFVNDIVKALRKLGFQAEGIHSDTEQTERETILNDFKNGKIQILVATDILSRGIDVDGVTHVVNFDCPQDPEDYIHRIGRTARAAAEGEAYTFVNAEDIRKLERIEQMMGREIPKLPLPESLGAGPTLSDARTEKGRSGPNKSFHKPKNIQGKSVGGSKEGAGGKRKFFKKSQKPSS
jgi:ATP-dependent RNA helicase RhlE